MLIFHGRCVRLLKNFVSSLDCSYVELYHRLGSWIRDTYSVLKIGDKIHIVIVRVMFYDYSDVVDVVDVDSEIDISISKFSENCIPERFSIARNITTLSLGEIDILWVYVSPLLL